MAHMGHIEGDLHFFDNEIPVWRAGGGGRKLRKDGIWQCVSGAKRHAVLLVLPVASLRIGWVAAKGDSGCTEEKIPWPTPLDQSHVKCSGMGTKEGKGCFGLGMSMGMGMGKFG